MSNLRYKSMEVFLAHAVALEREAVEQLREVAHMMEVHNNQGLYELFSELAGYGLEHAEAIEALARDRELPSFKPWEYEWPDDESPETGDTSDLHYQMTPQQALNLALSSERKAQHFYRDIAEYGETDKIRALAREFAEEEAEHVQLIEDKLKNTADVGADWAADLDPPHMPE
ncbi:MAG: ferritin family protein [Proteobacteria bacterium]|nr:ferritin family protein [Pseudomonadota bacterium]